MSYKVLVAGYIDRKCISYLESFGYEVFHTEYRPEDYIASIIHEYDAMLLRECPPTRKIMDSAEKIQIFSSYGVGSDGYDFEYAEKKGIWISNTPLGNFRSVAEHTMGMIIGICKNITIANNEVRVGNWTDFRDHNLGTELEGKTLGIIGIGRIGKTVGTMASAFGMNVVGYDPYIDGSQVPPNIEFSNLEDVFKKADILTIHCPGTQETTNIVNEETLSLMKRGSYIVNCARGICIDEKALYSAMISGQIRGVAVDMMVDDPPDLNNPLFKLKNFIITPHFAALTEEANLRMSMHAAESIVDVLHGERPRYAQNNPINPRNLAQRR